MCLQLCGRLLHQGKILTVNVTSSMPWTGVPDRVQGMVRKSPVSVSWFPRCKQVVFHHYHQELVRPPGQAHGDRLYVWSHEKTTLPSSSCFYEVFCYSPGFCWQEKQIAHCCNWCTVQQHVCPKINIRGTARDPSSTTVNRLSHWDGTKQLHAGNHILLGVTLQSVFHFLCHLPGSKPNHT